MRRLIVPALLIYCVMLFRASHQAITIDEVDAFNNFSAGNLDMSFYPSSGNHVLNSLLARFSTQAFGLSPFATRVPAMLGAALYLFAAACIVIRIAPKLKLLAFGALTLNPFVLDYLIASRGYSLAMGFLAAMVALGMRVLDEDPPPLRFTLVYAGMISVCGALALAANFSFAFTLICTAAAFLLLFAVSNPFKRWFSLAMATTFPGLLVALLLVGKTLRDYPRNQLYYGAETWPQMWSDMLDAVFPKENLQFNHLDAVLSQTRQASGYLILVPIAIGLWTAFVTKSRPISFVWLALTGTLAAHGLAHAFQGLLLPQDRTSLFIAFFLSIGVIHGMEAAPSRLTRIASSTVVCLSLLIFALAFRTNYFRMWYFDMDIDSGFHAFVNYVKEHPVESAGCTWRYNGAFAFYRAATKANVPECPTIDQDIPPPRGAYFVISPWQDDFVAKAKLKIIYKGPVSGLVVGIAPDKAN